MVGGIRPLSIVPHRPGERLKMGVRIRSPFTGCPKIRFPKYSIPQYLPSLAFCRISIRQTGPSQSSGYARRAKGKRYRWRGTEKHFRYAVPGFTIHRMGGGRRAKRRMTDTFVGTKSPRQGKGSRAIQDCLPQSMLAATSHIRCPVGSRVRPSRFVWFDGGYCSTSVSVFGIWEGSPAQKLP